MQARGKGCQLEEWETERKGRERRARERASERTDVNTLPPVRARRVPPLPPPRRFNKCQVRSSAT